MPREVENQPTGDCEGCVSLLYNGTCDCADPCTEGKMFIPDDVEPEGEDLDWDIPEILENPDNLNDPPN